MRLSNEILKEYNLCYVVLKENVQMYIPWSEGHFNDYPKEYLAHMTSDTGLIIFDNRLVGEIEGYQFDSRVKDFMKQLGFQTCWAINKREVYMSLKYSDFEEFV